MAGGATEKADDNCRSSPSLGLRRLYDRRNLCRRLGCAFIQEQQCQSSAGNMWERDIQYDDGRGPGGHAENGQ